MMVKNTPLYYWTYLVFVSQLKFIPLPQSLSNSPTGPQSIVRPLSWNVEDLDSWRFFWSRVKEIYSIDGV